MKNWTKYFKWVLNDKGSLLGDIFTTFGKSKKSEGWLIDPYTQKLRDIITPKTAESYYQFEQPGLESAVEQKLLGRLGRTTEDITGQFGAKATAPYYAAAKERMGEGFGEEQQFAKDIYQREGVLTSTPGIQGQIDLRRKQGQELEEFSQKLMYEDIAREIEATRMAEEIMGRDISQGTMLGGMQREYQKWPYEFASQAYGQAAGLPTAKYWEKETPGTLQKVGGIMNKNEESIMAILKMLGLG